LEPRQLADRLRNVYRMYFSFAVTSELTTPSTSSILAARREIQTQAYITDTLWARLLQVAFCLMAILDAIVTWLLYKRKLNLNSDPGSLAALVASITTSPALVSDFRGSEYISFEHMAEKLQSNDNRYHLITMAAGGHRIDKVTSGDRTTKPLPYVPTLYEDSDVAKAGPRSARPWELSTWTGAGVLLGLMGLIGLFTALYMSSQRYNGMIHQSFYRP
jgi:hypothetical protein